MTQSLSQFLLEQAKSSELWEGAALYERCLAGNQPNLQQADALYSYGYEFLGMAYTVYMHRVLEKIQQYGIDHVLFVAREGYLFKRIYEILMHYVPTAVSADVTTSYAYLSRMSTFLASAPQLTTRELVIADYKAVPTGLWSTLKYVGLPPEEFVSLAQSHGLDLYEPIPNYWSHPELLNFLNDPAVQSRVRHYHQQSYQNLQRYLEQCHFFGENRKVALVDIGWDGTIQDNLARAFNHLPTFPLLHGLYFGRREFKAFLKFSTSFSNGLMFDTRERSIHEKSLNSCVELFEKGAGAPHASTVGYDCDKNNFVRPVFKPEQSPSRQEEVAANRSIAVMQQGILDFAHQYGEQLKARPFSGEAVVPFTQCLITRHLGFPTSEEARNISHRLGQHAEDMGEEKTKSLVARPSEFWSALRSGNFKGAKRTLRLSTWRSGSLKLINIPGLHFLYIFKRYLS